MKGIIKETLEKLRLLKIASLIFWSASPRVICHNIQYWIKGAPDGLPIPPLKLRTRVWGKYADLKLFFQEEGHVQHVLEIIAQHGANPNEFKAVLDFGCGAGRATRQFRHLDKPLRNAKVYGTDINPKQIDWCRRNLSFAEFSVNDAHPPLPFEAESFDFIYNVAVFTHLPEEDQILWIKELARISKPGGYLLLATCGEVYLETLTPPEKERFLSGQLVVRHAEQGGSPSTYEACFAYHPVTFVEKSLAQDFEVVHFYSGKPVPQARPMEEMDHYFLRKPLRAGDFI